MVTYKLGVKISYEMTGLLELFLPVYCLGNMIFEVMLSNPIAWKSFESIYDADNGSYLAFLI